MALLFMDGFNHYATADITKKWASIASSPTINSGTGRRSGNSLRTTSFQQYVSKVFTAAASLVFGAAFKFTTLPTASSAVAAFYDAGTLQCDLRVNSDGTLSVTRNGTALTGGTSALALSPGVYYYIEWKVTIADSISAGSCKVRVNGADWITVATSQDTKNTSNASANQLLVGQILQTLASLTLDICDLYLCDNSGSTNNDFLGDCRIDTLYPASDGNYSQLTCSTGSTHYTLVDETAPNTTDYNSGSTVGDRDSYGMSDLSSISSQTVYGVQVNAAVLKDDAGSRSISTLVRSNGTNAEGSAVAIGTSQVYVSQIYETNPDGSVAWTQTTVNAAEAGVKIGA